MTDTVIVGGGIAGMSAAVSLASAGKRIVLLESRPHLGGRAWSYRDRESGDHLDNGQHIMLGCYSATFRFLRILDVVPEGVVKLRVTVTGQEDVSPPHPLWAVFRGGGQSRFNKKRAARHRSRTPNEGRTDIPLLSCMERMTIPMRRAGGNTAVLRAGTLPVPFNTAQMVMGYGFLPVIDRWKVLRLAFRLARMGRRIMPDLDTIPAAAWLRAVGQSDNAVRTLWNPICLATMNADVEDASAYLFALVLREIFLHNRQAQAVYLPAVGLSDIFARPAADYLTRHGAVIRLGRKVQSVSLHEDHVEVRCSDGSCQRARYMIIALPPWSLKPLLDASGLRFLWADDLPLFRPSSILSIHLWSHDRITDMPMTGLLSTRLQWVFDKGRSVEGMWRIACTISAYVEKGKEAENEVGQWVFSDLQRVYPTFDPTSVFRVRVHRERHATVLHQPGLEAKRPGTGSGHRRFLLAGDWTATNLPGTIESAVISGFRAAETVLGSLLGEGNENVVGGDADGEVSHE
ncbi:MAG: FAD-dependent oxidoreductase [Bacteroidota bacterium]|nr:FAD-dependent oxidoreductase [Bacteroidota bacterium]